MLGLRVYWGRVYHGMVDYGGVYYGRVDYGGVYYGRIHYGILDTETVIPRHVQDERRF